MTDSQSQPEDQTPDDPSSDADESQEGHLGPSDQQGPSGQVPSDQKAADLDQGPGWMPAIMAGTVLLGLFSFICCGVSTWVLFQKRTEFAVRTLKDWYVPQLEQSYLDPDDKKAVIERIEKLAQEMDAGKYENWQSAAVMQRLQRLPVLQWGELSAVEIHIKQSDDVNRDEMLKQISRLRRGVELGKVTAFDFEDVLKPVMVSDDEVESGRRLSQPLDDQSVRRVIEKAESVADRGEVPDKRFDVNVDNIVRREIEAAINEGGY